MMDGDDGRAALLPGVSSSPFLYDLLLSNMLNFSSSALLPPPFLSLSMLWVADIFGHFSSRLVVLSIPLSVFLSLSLSFCLSFCLFLSFPVAEGFLSCLLTLDIRNTSRRMSSLGEKLAERQAKRDETKKKAQKLGLELDGLLQAKKEREAALQGKKAERNYTLYQTLFKFESDDPEDLTFDAGEILRVFDDSSDWYEGEDQQGKRGYFPKNFVRKINAPSTSSITLPDNEGEQ
eukprot:m.31093 g.31093  ORF g.31093 m.31093 type:complete len:234 (+) comp10666_c0_seq2:82-783(+)